MKRLQFIILIVLLATLNLFGVSYFDQYIPEDSVVVYQINNAQLIYETVKEMGLQQDLITALDNLFDRALMFTPEDIHNLSKSKFFFALIPAEKEKMNMKVIGGVHINDSKLYQKFSQLVKMYMNPGNAKISALGKFVIYTGLRAEKKPLELHSFAIGASTILFGLGVDVSQYIKSALAGNKSFQWPQLTNIKGEPLNNLADMRLCLKTTYFKKVINDYLDKYVRKAKESRENARKAARKKNNKNSQQKPQKLNPAEQIQKMFPPENVVKFVHSLGLGNIQMVNFRILSNEEKVNLSSNIDIKPDAGGMLGAYLKDVNSKTLVGYKSLPAGILSFQDSIVDFPYIYELFAKALSDSFGSQGQMFSMQLDMVASMKFGISLQKDVFPLIGSEFGTVYLNREGVDKDGIFFFVPQKGVHLYDVVAKVEKAASVKFKEEVIDGTKIYSMLSKGNHSFVMAQTKHQLLLSADVENIKQYLSLCKGGKTILEDRTFKLYLADISPETKSIIVSKNLFCNIFQLLKKSLGKQKNGPDFSKIKFPDSENVTVARSIFFPGKIIATTEISRKNLKSMIKLAITFVKWSVQQKKKAKKIPDNRK